MKEKLIRLVEKAITGAYSVKLKREVYMGVPKVFPIFALSFIISAIGSTKDNNLITALGLLLTVIGIFGFFYYNLFPGRLPKGK